MPSIGDAAAPFHQICQFILVLLVPSADFLSNVQKSFLWDLRCDMLMIDGSERGGISTADLSCLAHRSSDGERPTIPGPLAFLFLKDIPIQVKCSLVFS